MRQNIITTLAIATVAWTGGTDSAHAQTGVGDARVDVSRAVELETEASVANGDSRRWLFAASMLREAAQLRPQNDPVALTDLRTAGAIYGTIGEFERARRTMLELADRATEFGEVATAAHALMDAAHVAVQLKDVRLVRSYFERAQRLALSSHLTAEEQRLIRTRLERSPSLFASASR